MKHHETTSREAQKRAKKGLNTMKERPEESEQDPPVLHTSDVAPIGPPASSFEEGDHEEETYFTIEEEEGEGPDNEDQERDQDGESSAFATPFQSSMPLHLPGVKQQGPSSRSSGGRQPISASSRGKSQKGTRIIPLWTKIALFAAVILIALGFLWFTVFAQPAAQPLATQGPVATVHPLHSTSLAQGGKTPTVKLPPTSIVGTGVTSTAAGPGVNWVPQQLPVGWANAGLTIGDALFAERTAWTFSDREESVDSRNVGTRTQHAGTFTAATFILSPGGKVRFQQNDVRVINNVLFDTVTNRQLVQAEVNAVPRLLQFQIQGQNEFAWVDVAFQLYQSQLDPNDPQHAHRIEGFELDPATNQPRIHHMNVLLVRVTPQTQGQGAPMGGSGWLVSNYGLDMPNNAQVDALQPV